jgi:hypothetical protein
MADNNVLLADFTEQIKASHNITCDACGAKLGEYYPKSRQSIAVSLPMGKAKDDSDGDETPMKTHHFCNAKCLKGHMAKTDY